MQELQINGIQVQDISITDIAVGERFRKDLGDVENLSAAATTGDNTVDNVEKIEIADASGDYTVTVTHKGNLVNEIQDFSIVITGINEGDFRLLSQVDSLKLCDTEDAVYTFNYEKTDKNHSQHMLCSGYLYEYNRICR